MEYNILTTCNISNFLINYNSINILSKCSDIVSIGNNISWDEILGFRYWSIKYNK